MRDFFDVTHFIGTPVFLVFCESRCAKLPLIDKSLQDTGVPVFIYLGTQVDNQIRAFFDAPPNLQIGRSISNAGAKKPHNSIRAFFREN